MESKPIYTIASQQLQILECPPIIVIPLLYFNLNLLLPTSSGKNAAWLQVIKYTSLEDELRNPALVRPHCEAAIEDPSSNVVWYVLLRAADRFFTLHRQFPCECSYIELQERSREWKDV